MGYKYYTILEICEWYTKNVNHSISQSLIKHMVERGIINRLPNKRYSLSEINNLLLIKEDCEYIKDIEGKFMLKENRLPLLEVYKDITSIKEESKFTITKLEGNKLKLSKI